MSYDLDIALRRRPSSTAIEHFGKRARLALTVSGPFGPTSNTLVTLRRRSVERTIDVDGPSRVDADDLADDLAGSVRGPRWLVTLHLPGGRLDADEWAVELAIDLARAGDGAVHDPQADAIVWPRGVVPRVRGSTEERIRVVVVQWIIPWSRLQDDWPERWLTSLRATYPAGLPVRFGAFEPLAGRLDRDGDLAFVSACRDAVEGRPWGALLYTTGTPPVFDTTLFVPDRRRGPPDATFVAQMTVDGRPLHRDPTAADAMVEALASIAATWRALYAEAVVRRDYLARGSRLTLDERSEAVAHPVRRGGRFAGLPASEPWVAWYGEEYAPLVAHAFESVGHPYASGLLVRHGREPMDADELSAAPRPPVELLGPQASRVPRFDR